MLRPSHILRAPHHPAASIMVKNLTVFGAGLMGAFFGIFRDGLCKSRLTGWACRCRDCAGCGPEWIQGHLVGCHRGACCEMFPLDVAGVDFKPWFCVWQKACQCVARDARKRPFQLIHLASARAGTVCRSSKSRSEGSPRRSLRASRMRWKGIRARSWAISRR